MSNSRAITPAVAQSNEAIASLGSLPEQLFRSVYNLLRDVTITNALSACRRELRKG